MVGNPEVTEWAGPSYGRVAQNSALQNYRSLGREKSGIARDPASGHTLRGAGSVLGVFAAGRLSLSSEQVSTVSSYIPQRHRSGGDLHSLLALGGGRSTAVCAHQLAACRRGPTRLAGDLALSDRRHH